MVAVLVVLGSATAVLGSVQAARGAARSAADLGAIAGAQAVRAGGPGCAVAAEAVRRNGADLVACELEGGGIVGVRAARAPQLAAGVLGSAQATARAGPRPVS
ncbi:Rv3654c family TadE-like protein [Paraoerskovia sediminicola]|nr:Rv3654c family TadE-like protein [Paraoerskovia sediminicola]